MHQIRHFSLVFSLILLMAGILMTSSSSLSAAETSLNDLQDARPDQIVDFKQTEQGELKLHIFEPATSSKNEKRPAIVFFFGGGWVSGSPKQFYPHCQHLADNGIVAISAEYRIKSKHDTTPFECVEDGKSAIRWVRQHAEQFNIDPDRIAAGGGSAGGHVAATTATLTKFDNPEEDNSISSVPNALLLFNPVADTTDKGWAGGPKRLGERAAELSPLQHINANTPPTIIFHGTGDTTVRYENVERFQQAMEAKGLRCELHGYEGRPHGFFNYTKNKDDFADTIEKMDDFLISLGWLKK
ncbi:alpha/beta hydrolase [uncultured Rubinisphaera sp.]|uniref:alpha/beta hydrolase n=1 Tax=uncultured Rubinisphaera sp. TaxID=1678686 RepID=UPI0030D9581C